ncbi:zinc ribbon domain-containing protein [Actinobacillus minor]|uniref:zinc ribbon domain-containing protein n=1 Tax=Actinobacillus minor TaxID=51047 RepID=UPI0023EFB8D4|nr:zinc ribbon domain-containing protein [Actinobacillus minor]MDD6910443.1 zinc ribbon domain-containing protein [Actinobacillus minor]MDY4713833.1 zinc ribbon domain-containing protein [Actinobacillus minor]
MALHRCPECRKKISESAEVCPHCGFSFKTADLEAYKQKLEARRLHNQELNRQSSKIQLVWLLIFIVVLTVAAWFKG